MLGCCCSGSRPADLGVRQNGQLRPAPGSPNCVCSDAPRSDSLHFIEPLVVTVSPDVAWQRAASTLSSWEGAVIADRNDQYMHVEVSSKVRDSQAAGSAAPPLCMLPRRLRAVSCALSCDWLPAAALR
jgi:uncharacterized protein (DUF1499 family)